jgi:hypothetical protein
LTARHLNDEDSLSEEKMNINEAAEHARHAGDWVSRDKAEQSPWYDGMTSPDAVAFLNRSLVGMLVLLLLKLTSYPILVRQ